MLPFLFENLDLPIRPEIKSGGSIQIGDRRPGRLLSLQELLLQDP